MTAGEWLFYGAGAATLAWAGWVGWRRQGGRPLWRAAGHALGLDEVQVRGHTWHLAGEVDGWWVSARDIREGDRQKTELLVRPGSAGRLSAKVAFAAEPQALGRLLVQPDRTLGDPAFDAAVRIGDGPWPTVLALLDGTTRNRLMACVADGVLVQGGELLAVAGDPGAVAPTLEARLRRMLALAKALDLSEDDVPVRLARNARRDFLAAVRGANLQALLAAYPDHPLTAAALRAAQVDRDATVRFTAAQALGVAGRTVLAGVVDDAKAPAALRARALTQLAADAPADWVAALLINHAGPEAPAEVRAVVAHHAAQRGVQAALLSLLQDPHGVPDGALARAARAAAPSGALAEPSLLALAQDGGGAARVAAVETLGEIGGPAAAGLLRPLTRGLTASSELKAAAQAALDRLADRLATSPGALSLIRDHAAGGLALSERPPGALAPSEDGG